MPLWTNMFLPGVDTLTASGSDLYGSKPHLPPWHSLDLGVEQNRAIANNEAAAPEASRLANLTEDQLLSMLRQVMPGFDASRDQISKNINAELKGEIPQDVQDAISNSAAARALGGGYGGSGMHSDLVARDLGLTSLSLMDKGLSSAESWLASTERMLSPAMAVYTNMFVTPQQQAAFDSNERDEKWAHDWLGAQIAAMPDPEVAGQMNTEMSMLATLRGSAQPTRDPNTRTPTSNIGQKTGTTDNSNWASGWETADGGASLDDSMMGYAAANQGAGVSSGVDWTAGQEAYFGALA